MKHLLLSSHLWSLEASLIDASFQPVGPVEPVRSVWTGLGYASSIQTRGRRSFCFSLPVAILLKDDYFIGGAGLPGRFKAEKVEFHWGPSNGSEGSEHSVNGRRFPVEVRPQASPPGNQLAANASAAFFSFSRHRAATPSVHASLPPCR